MSSESEVDFVGTAVQSNDFVGAAEELDSEPDITTKDVFWSGQHTMIWATRFQRIACLCYDLWFSVVRFDHDSAIYIYNRIMIEFNMFRTGSFSKSCDARAP